MMKRILNPRRWPDENQAILAGTITALVVGLGVFLASLVQR